MNGNNDLMLNQATIEKAVEYLSKPGRRMKMGYVKISEMKAPWSDHVMLEVQTDKQIYGERCAIKVPDMPFDLIADAVRGALSAFAYVTAKDALPDITLAGVSNPGPEISMHGNHFDHVFIEYAASQGYDLSVERGMYEVWFLRSGNGYSNYIGTLEGALEYMEKRK